MLLTMGRLHIIIFVNFKRFKNNEHPDVNTLRCATFLNKVSAP